jgi:chaperonin GroES
MQQRRNHKRGTVISIGEGRMLDSGQRNSLTVKVGDRVLFSKYGGNEVTIDGKEYTILDEDQVYAIINN